MVKSEIVILVSADDEWRVLKQTVQPKEIEFSPFGEWFTQRIAVNNTEVPLVFFQTGCGKIPAAAATQYALDFWGPQLIINLGACGGFEGKARKGDVFIAKRTVVYDVHERSGRQIEQIDKYATDIDLSWLERPYPMNAAPVVFASGDQDLNPENVGFLNQEYGAVAGDWESGAIAYVAWKKNKVNCLIVREVSDVVGGDGSEIYEDPDSFLESLERIIPRLLRSLPEWLLKAKL